MKKRKFNVIDRKKPIYDTEIDLSPNTDPNYKAQPIRKSLEYQGIHRRKPMIFVGDFVMMTEEHKQKLIQNGCQAYVDEFGDCVGVVEADNDGELTVIWQPSNLKYHFMREMLVRV